MRKKIKLGALWGFLGMAGVMGFAAQVPVPLTSDARIQQVVFNPNNVVKVTGSPMTTTQIMFADDEVIKEVQNGDTAGWSSSLNPSLPNMMFLKPVVKDSDTNMTVVTNQHLYYFELDSRTNAQGQVVPTYAIKFVYPREIWAEAETEVGFKAEEKKIALSAFENPEKFNWDYSFNGDKSILPLHVFDDGTFTYLQLAPNQPVPSVFMVDNKEGKEAVVNIRTVGSYLVIQQVAPQLTLRLGPQHVASLFNGKKIAELRRRG